MWEFGRLEHKPLSLSVLVSKKPIICPRQNPEATEDRYDRKLIKTVWYRLGLTVRNDGLCFMQDARVFK